MEHSCQGSQYNASQRAPKYWLRMCDRCGLLNRYDYTTEVDVIENRFQPESDRLVRLQDFCSSDLKTPSRARDLLQQSLSNAGIPYQELVAGNSEFPHYRSQEMPFSKFLTSGSHHRNHRCQSASRYPDPASTLPILRKR